MSDKDAWATKIPRYERFYEDEWKKVRQQNLYDFDGDAQFEDSERKKRRSRRLVRS